jgi:hypothetical protein
LEKSWLCTTKYQLGPGTPDCPMVHRTVSGGASELMVNRLFSGDAAIIHRTVRWCTGLSGESSAANSSLSRKEKGDMAIIHWTVRWCTRLSGETMAPAATIIRAINARHVARSNGRLGAPDYPVCTGHTIWPRGATVGYARYGRRPRTGHEQ